MESSNVSEQQQRAKKYRKSLRWGLFTAIFFLILNFLRNGNISKKIFFNSRVVFREFGRVKKNDGGAKRLYYDVVL